MSLQLARGPAPSCRAQSSRRSAARRSSTACIASMRRVQQSNQAWLSSASSATPGGRRAGDAAQALELGQLRRRAGWRARASTSAGPEKSAKTWKQRSCDSIRCSHCCWRAPSLRPEAKAAAPQARSWPANSLPCMKLNIATSRREISGSVAPSAASNTTASSPATSLTKAAVASAGVSSSAPMRRRSSGRASRPGSTQAMRLNRRAPLPTRPAVGLEPVEAGAHRFFHAQAFGDLRARAAPRSAGRREASSTFEMPRSRCSAWTRRPIVPTSSLVRASCSSSSISHRRAATRKLSPDFIVVGAGRRGRWPIAKDMQQHPCPGDRAPPTLAACLYWESNPPATKPAWRWSSRGASGLPRAGARMRCTARSRCTRPTAAWCPNWRAATTSGACCRWRRRCCREAGRALADIDVVAYTRGPGLAGALLVGAGVACALGAALGKPVLGVHHLEGHLLSPFLSADPPEFPFVALLVSGGHTQLMRVDGVGRYELLGETIDDAAGEAFDKSAKLMGLPYPGGPWLAQAGGAGRCRGLQAAAAAAAQRRPGLLLRRAQDGGADAGHASSATQLEARKADLAASTAGGDRRSAAEEVAGGARADRPEAAGGRRRRGRQPASCAQQLNAACAKRGVRVHYPELHLCTDNGAMIAMAAAMRLQAGCRRPTRALRLRRQAAMATGVAERAGAAVRLGVLSRRASGSGSTSSILRQSCDHCGQSWPPSVVNTRPGRQRVGQQLVVGRKAVGQAEAQVQRRQFRRPAWRRRIAAARARACGRLPRPAAGLRAPSRRAGRRPCGSRRRAGGAQIGRQRHDAVDRAGLGQFVDQRAEAADRDADQPDATCSPGRAAAARTSWCSRSMKVWS